MSAHFGGGAPYEGAGGPRGPPQASYAGSALGTSSSSYPAPGGGRFGGPTAFSGGPSQGPPQQFYYGAGGGPSSYGALPPGPLQGTAREGVIKEGWLSKQSKFLKDWRRRWFVLTPQCLCSYKTSDVRSQKPTEVLYLRDCSTVKSADEDVHKANAFRVDTPQRVFLLLAETQQEKESWIGHIGRQMVRPSVLTEYAD